MPATFHEPHEPPIGLVGLGLVGTALARRLAAAGRVVLGYDLRPEARAAFAAQVPGARAVDTLRAVGAQAAQVVLAVFETRDVLAVVEGGMKGGMDGAGDAEDPGTDSLLAGGTVRCLVDCSTGDPEALQALATRLAARGIDFIEAPLSGSSGQIAEGRATMLLGAAQEALVRHEPLLALLAERRLHVGGPGLGAKAKLATNLVLGLNRAVLAEGLVFAEGLGIAPERFVELVLATPATSGAAEAKGQMMAEGRFEPPQSRIRQHLKDVLLMLQQAAAQGQRLPLSETHAALMRAAVECGDGELDNAAIVRQLRRERAPSRTSSNEPTL